MSVVIMMTFIHSTMPVMVRTEPTGYNMQTPSTVRLR